MVSFYGIGQLMVTMLDGGVQVGQPCKLTNGKTAAAAGSGDPIHGVCLWRRDGLAGVQIKGFTTLDYTGQAPQVGYQALSGNGTGGVAVSSSGPERLVADVDETANTVTFYI